MNEERKKKERKEEREREKGKHKPIFSSSFLAFVPPFLVGGRLSHFFKTPSENAKKKQTYLLGL